MILFLKKIFTIFSISLFFLNFFNSVALGAVSGVVDSFQVTQRIATGVVFNPNGTKMYISGMSQNKVYEFDLTTGFDISTATKNSNECNHQPKDEDVADLRLNSDGTKLFLVGSENNILLEYSLSTAYDVSTCSYENTFFSGGGLDPRSMAFNTNGTKLFIYDQTGNYSVKQYSLNSAYNLTNATLEKQYTGTASETLKEIEQFAQGMAFSADGTKMYLTGDKEDNVVEFTLSTPFDLSDVTKEGAYSVAGEITKMSGIAFSADGLKMFITDFHNGDTSKDVTEFDLTCGFGVIKCIDPTANKDDVASIETQSEGTKKLIQHTTYPVLNRMEWLRRNSGRINLTNQNIKFQFNNEMLNALSSSLIPLYFSNDNSNESNYQNSNWSFWSEGSISIGRTGDSTTSSFKDIKTSGITLGADKKGEDDIMRGIALKFGADDVDVGDLGSALDMSSFSLTFYESRPKGEKRFVDHLLGLSFLNSDLINNSGSQSTNGDRYGEQLYGSLSLRDTFSKNKFNFTPKLKISYGITHLGGYSESGSTGLNLEFDDQYIGNFTSSLGTSLENIYDLKIGTFIPYFDFEYYADMSPSSKQTFSYISNGESFTLKNINNSTHNIMSSIGFDFTSENGLSLMTKYTRDQAKQNKNDSFVIALDYKNSQRSLYTVSLKDTSAEFSHNRKFKGLNLDVDTHYGFLKDDPDYGATIEVSSMF